MSKKTVAFIWGAGAVENSWSPIFKSLQPLYLDRSLNKDEANMLLALLVYNMRFYASQNTNSGLEILETCKSMLNNHRQNISKQIQYYQSTGQMKVWKEFDEIVSKIVTPNCSQLSLLTTNWDTVIEEALQKHPYIEKLHKTNMCIHMHGIYNNPDMLYLPTETINEKYRSIGQEYYLGQQQLYTMASLQKAQILIIYGLSISPLDAELLQCLSTALSLNPIIETIKIIDLDHSTVANRMKIITQNRNSIKIEGYHPQRLDQAEVYL